MALSTGCTSVGALAITRRISPVVVCCAWLSRSSELDDSSSRWQDLSCSVRRCTSFLSWLSSVACGLFFFFETPSRAMWVLLTPTLEDFQRLTVRRRLINVYILVRERSRQ